MRHEVANAFHQVRSRPVPTLVGDALTEPRGRACQHRAASSQRLNRRAGAPPRFMCAFYDES
jgi:hypothetical protein